MYKINTTDKIIKLLLFIIINYIVLKIIIKNNISTYTYLQISIINTICFIFINTYYPCIKIIND